MASLPRRLLGGSALATIAASAAVLGLGACFAVAPHGIHRVTDDPDAGAGGGGGLFDTDAAPPENLPPDASTDPHSVIGASPSHGPFAGGDRILIHGKGFASTARVWFGDTEVDHGTLVAIDPPRVQVSAPPGKHGPVDVSEQNGTDASTKRTLTGGYTYDQLYAVPDTGAVPGGEVIEILGQDTAWDATTIAKIDLKPCTKLVVVSPTVLTCTVPPGAPGSKPIVVTTGSETITVLDAYTYADSDNGYKGGLSGAAISGKIKVLAYDNYSGSPIAGAHVIVGSDVATAIKTVTDGMGVAVVSDPSLKGPVTVTVSATCHSPISFVAEPVDTVTTYLDPVMSPLCSGKGDPPPVGGKPSATGTVTGELVWPMVGEFKKGPWTNVPNNLKANEARTAYVFAAGNDPTAQFQLPQALDAITEMTPGDLGYKYALTLGAGNRAIYALAGIEDRSVSPPKFTAYVMGVAKGVAVLPDKVTDTVTLSMNKTLDQALQMDVHAPPPGAKGPDRLRATVSVMLGNNGFEVLPVSRKVPLLPLPGLLSFVGVPALDGDLAGTVYYTTARAQTGSQPTTPISVITRILATSTSQPILVDGFVNIPTLVTPPVSGAWDGKHLEAKFAPGGAPIELTVYEIQSGNGLVHWTVAVPPGQAAVVPDIGAFVDNSALPAGPLQIGVYGAHILGFNYGACLYRNLRPQGMTAYSLDYFAAHK